MMHVFDIMQTKNADLGIQFLFFILLYFLDNFMIFFQNQQCSESTIGKGYESRAVYYCSW